MLSVKEYLEIYKKYPHQDDEDKSNYNKLVEYNKELCEMYPFLIPRDYCTGSTIDDYDYSYTELDSMPDGWRIAFGMQMCEEIKQALLKVQKEDPNGGYEECDITNKYDSNKIIPYLEGYSIVQIKEKYGGLRWYDIGAPKGVYDVVIKYEKLSYELCVRCGELAEYESEGWICPYCGKCANKIFERSLKGRGNFEDYFVKLDELEEE